MITKRLTLKLRLIFWGIISVLFITVLVPIILFFLLFNENQVRTLIESQFTNNTYHVSINGGVIPEFWHGLALEIRQFNIVSNNGDDLLKIQNIHCQLSWWWLIIGQYKVKHIALSNTTIYQQNIVNNKFLNTLNVYEIKGSYFDAVPILEGSGINIIQQNQLYTLKDVAFKVKRSINGIISAQLVATIHKDIPLVLTTDITMDNEHIMRFSNFIIHIAYHLSLIHI
jgi:hypothetical protein